MGRLHFEIISYLKLIRLFEQATKVYVSAQVRFSIRPLTSSSIILTNCLRNTEGQDDRPSPLDELIRCLRAAYSSRRTPYSDVLRSWSIDKRLLPVEEMPTESEVQKRLRDGLLVDAVTNSKRAQMR